MNLMSKIRDVARRPAAVKLRALVRRGSLFCAVCDAPRGNTSDIDTCGSDECAETWTTMRA